MTEISPIAAVGLPDDHDELAVFRSAHHRG
jgi:hypothetical protein